jgi:poly-gamma-glutamate synthesis protein (capsule biosynthesis protein)
MDIIFTGDLSGTGIFNKKITHNEEVFSNTLIDEFLSANNIISNLEGPCTNKENTQRKDVHVVSPENLIDYLSKYNFNIFNLANNHIFDCEVDGFNDTIQKIKSNKSQFFGAGYNNMEASSPLIICHNNVSVSLIGVCHKEGLIASKQQAGILCDEDEALIKEQLLNAKKQSDWVILNYHGGEEFTTYPMPKRREKLKNYLDLGADIVVAHHPHMFQGYEKIDNKSIFYSLGNFMFDIPDHRHYKESNNSALLKIKFNKKSYTSSFIPIFIDTSKGIITQNKDFLTTINKLSNFENYLEKWEESCYKIIYQAKRQSNNPFKRFFSSFKPILFLFFLLKFHKIKKQKNFFPIFKSATQYYLKSKIKFLFKNKP